MSARDVAGKLRRLLFVVPYVAKHPGGVPVEDLASWLTTQRERQAQALRIGLKTR